MIDFGKIYCNLHPHELITNFCSKDECLIGLCANCVCTHTQLHMQKGSAPDYQNIRNTYKQAQDSIRAHLEFFEKDKERIGKINEKVAEKRRKLKQIMDVAKQEVSLLLGTYFDDKEKNMMRQIESQEKKYGLHCENRLESLNSYISREVSNLISAAQELSSNNFLESLPRVRTQCLVNSFKLHSQIESQIKQNEAFSTTISCNKGLLHTLTQVLDKAITIGFSGDPLHERAKGEQQIFSRPKSQGKLPERPFHNEANLTPNINIKSLEGFNHRDRNSQSQVQINYPQQYRNSGEIRRSSYLNEVQNMMTDHKPFEQGKQKISATLGANPNQHLANITPTYSQISNNGYSGLAGKQAFNLPLSMPPASQFYNGCGGNENAVRTNRLVEQPASYRSADRLPSSPANQPTAYPCTAEPLQSRPLERSMATGLNKKSKKSGLKLLTTTSEVEGWQRE